ncbi:hypothetical protein EGW08_016358 [Elysia chlorotica]|uniref:Transposable element P transposase-like RNase H domain-containing protein n=1 Tax=Elysia chlorotica TaxID=188477 RepID=A0A433T2S7_ELYCH|nr:hypothetical protein EGW08_016358 [Elysia chlorotica]
MFLLVDEAKIKPTVAFSGGILSDMAVNNSECKATNVLCVMAKCLHGEPSVMISVTPVHKMTAMVQFNEVKKAATLVEKSGGTVLGSITDNHKVNQLYVNVSAKGQDIRLKDPHRAVQDSSSTSLDVYATHFEQADSGHGKTRVQCLTHNTKKALVARAEALFTAFITEHNFPLAVADHAGELFRKMFPDSAIAKKYRCARTKTRGLVGVLAKEGKQETVDVLKDGRPFSLSTDGSNDKGGEQLYPVLVRYHDNQKVVTDVLSITTTEGYSTGEEIFLALDRELQASGLDWGSCISFGSDNASGC